MNDFKENDDYVIEDLCKELLELLFVVEGQDEYEKFMRRLFNEN